MRNLIVVFIVFAAEVTLYSQSFPPAAGQPGTSAIHKDSSVIIAWANGIFLERGYLNKADTTIEINGNNRASYGLPSDALGIAEGNPNNVVSLGDQGVAVLTFETPIADGPGYDFVIFENSFSSTYLEFAHVEVSSDGINFARFESTSEISILTQTGPFSPSDPTYINNLAGKYQAGYGTPFNLSEVDGNPLVQVYNIRFVRIIDAVGSINPTIGTMDGQGVFINDPFPTPFESCGFDLDGVGVINNQDMLLSLDKNEIIQLQVYPNPTSGSFKIDLSSNTEGKLSIFSIQGGLIKSIPIMASQKEIFIDEQFEPGRYVLRYSNPLGSISKSLIVF